jgi:DNA-binding transcriptional MocR family regulator
MPDALDITLPEGGTHLLARLRGDSRDLDVVARLRENGIGPTALSRCSFESPRQNGLVINATNIAAGDAVVAAERLRAAMR